MLSIVRTLRNDIPRCAPVGKQLLQLGLKSKDEESKKKIGRWVREIMDEKGWTIPRKGKLPRGNLFSTGMVYRPLRSSGR